MPPVQQSKFVEDHLDTWFNTVFPIVIETAIINGPLLDLYVTTVENLTQILILMDYETNAAWDSIFCRICSPDK